MTQDLQPRAEDVSTDLPDSTVLPVADTPTSESGRRHSEPVPKHEPSASDAPKPASDAAATVLAQALEIAELCQLAGQSNRIASFLAQGISAGQVRQSLLLSRAQSEEISSLIHPDAANPVARSSSDGASALMAAVKKLSGTA